MPKKKIQISNIEGLTNEKEIELTPRSKYVLNSSGILLKNLMPKNLQEIILEVKTEKKEIIEMYKNHYEIKRKEKIKKLIEDYQKYRDMNKEKNNDLDKKLKEKNKEEIEKLLKREKKLKEAMERRDQLNKERERKIREIEDLNKMKIRENHLREIQRKKEEIIRKKK